MTFALCNVSPWISVTAIAMRTYQLIRNPLTISAACLACLMPATAETEGFHYLTVAGKSGMHHRDGTNTQALFGHPSGIGVHPDGRLFVADRLNFVVRQLEPRGSDWAATTILGAPGTSGSQAGTGAAASFMDPARLCYDATLNALFIIDQSAIRRAVPADGGWAVAGSWAGSFSTGTDSGFNSPQAVASDGQGNLYVADTGNSSIKKVESLGGLGRITRIAGPLSVSAPSPGYRDGSGATALFNGPQGIAVYNRTNLFVADTGNRVIRKITYASGSWTTTTLAGSAGVRGWADGTNGSALFESPSALCVNAKGDIYVVDDEARVLRKITMQASQAVVTTIAGKPYVAGTSDGTNSEALFNAPTGIAQGNGGELYVVDIDSGTVRSVGFAETNTIVKTIAGDPYAHCADGAGEQARMLNPKQITKTAGDRFLIADSQNHVIRQLERLNGIWQVSTVAGVLGIKGEVEGDVQTALFRFPTAATTDKWGCIYVADENRVCRITPTETNWWVQTISGKDGERGIKDGTNGVATLYSPNGMVVDESTNVIVGTGYGLRKISPIGTNWVTSTISGGFGSADGTNKAAGFMSPTALARDSVGNIFVADSFNNTIRRVTQYGTNWVVTTIAGLAGSSGFVDGTNNAAKFSYPASIAVDSQDNIFVADRRNHAIRRVSPSGTNWVVQTVGGFSGVSGYQDGSFQSARFAHPLGVAVMDSGDLLVSDSWNDVIRLGIRTPEVRLLSMQPALLRWPGWATNFVAEGRRILDADAAWEPLPIPSLVNGELWTTNTETSDFRFFRLRHQP